MVWNECGPRAVSERSAPPTVVVRDGGAAAAVLREIRAGAEEEGVPTSVEEPTSADDVVDPAPALAHSAALASRLEVGVGIDAAGGVAVHHASLPPDVPAYAVPAGGDAPAWRRAGAVAARMVTGLPIA